MCVLLSFLISICLLIKGTHQQNLKPKYHNSSVIHEGEQLYKTLNPHEIFILQIDSLELQLQFMFHAEGKKALFYMYRTEDIENSLLTESELVLMLTFSQLNEPQIINGYSLFSSKIKYAHSLTNENQVILLLYCAYNVSCDYFISCMVIQDSDEAFHLNLIDNQSFLYSSTNDFYWEFQLPGKDDTLTTFYLNATGYTGLFDLNEFSINGTKVDVNKKYIGNQIMISFQTPSNALIKILQTTYRMNFIIYHYRFTEPATDSLNIEIDITKIYSVDINHKQKFSMYKETFSKNVPIIFNIKADNCYLKIDEMSTKSISYSITPDYY